MRAHFQMFLYYFEFVCFSLIILTKHLLVLCAAQPFVKVHLCLLGGSQVVFA